MSFFLPQNYLKSVLLVKLIPRQIRLWIPPPSPSCTLTDGLQQKDDKWVVFGWINGYYHVNGCLWCSLGGSCGFQKVLVFWVAEACVCVCVYALLASFLCILYIFGLLNGSQLNWMWKRRPYAQIFHHVIKRDMQNTSVWDMSFHSLCECRCFIIPGLLCCNHF